MISQIFAIYDTAAQSYSPPFVSHTKGMAIRLFSETSIDKTTTIGRHPADYTLFHLGEYDDLTASFSPLSTPVPVIKALETISED